MAYQQYSSTPPPGEPARKSLPKGLWAGIIAGGMVLSLGIGMFAGSLFSNNDGGVGTPTEETTAQRGEDAPTDDTDDTDDTQDESTPKQRVFVYKADATVEASYVSRMREKVPQAEEMTDEDIVNIGYAACERLDAGVDFVTVMKSVREVEGDFYSSTFLAGGAVQSFCPVYMPLMEAYMDGDEPPAPEVPIVDYEKPDDYVLDAVREYLVDIDSFSDDEIMYVTEKLCFGFHKNGGGTDGIEKTIQEVAEETGYGLYEVTLLSVPAGGYRCEQWSNDISAYLDLGLDDI